VTLVVPAPPDFSVSVSPASRSTLAGGSVGYSVTVASQSGFTDDVALSLGGLTGAPASWAFAPATVTGGAGSSTLTVTTTGALAPGSYPLTITGTSGQRIRSATVTLVVSAVPDFALSASPASATVIAGQSTSFTITAASVSGFAGNVSLSVAGLPSAATATFSPSPVRAPGTSTLTVRTTRTTTRGTFTVRITGKSGSLVHQATVTLVVRS
jgi:hypothetical protein